MLGDVQTIGYLVNSVFNIEDPFSSEIQHVIDGFFALLDTLRSAFTSSMVNSSVWATRSSTEEAKFTGESSLQAFLAE